MVQSFLRCRSTKAEVDEQEIAITADCSVECEINLKARFAKRRLRPEHRAGERTGSRPQIIVGFVLGFGPFLWFFHQLRMKYGCTNALWVLNRLLELNRTEGERMMSFSTYLDKSCRSNYLCNNTMSTYKT